MINQYQNRPTTPARITEGILKLCRKIDPTQNPILVPVKPWNKSDASFCFFNVRDKVARDGGGIQYGWIIWETPGILIEGEFHAVWVSPESELIDITPKEDGEQQILFLPDPSCVWKGEMVENIRMPLVDNTYTRQLIRYSEEITRIRKKYYKDGQSQIPYDEILRVEQQFGVQTLDFNRMAVARNARCPCGSGKKYKKCCGG